MRNFAWLGCGYVPDCIHAIVPTTRQIPKRRILCWDRRNVQQQRFLWLLRLGGVVSWNFNSFMGSGTCLAGLSRANSMGCGRKAFDRVRPCQQAKLCWWQPPTIGKGSILMKTQYLNQKITRMAHAMRIATATLPLPKLARGSG